MGRWRASRYTARRWRSWVRSSAQVVASPPPPVRPAQHSSIRERRKNFRYIEVFISLLLFVPRLLLFEFITQKDAFLRPFSPLKNFRPKSNIFPPATIPPHHSILHNICTWINLKLYGIYIKYFSYIILLFYRLMLQIWGYKRDRSKQLLTLSLVLMTGGLFGLLLYWVREYWLYCTASLCPLSKASTVLVMVRF